MSNFLNSFFAGYDHAILSALHQLAEMTGGALNPVFTVVSIFAEKGIGMFLLGIILMCFKKTRKMGVCVFGAVCCGAIITNVVLKDMIARPRPFMNASSIYHNWWAYAGMTMEDGFSFPSGHVTATMAAMMAVFLSSNKKKHTWPVFFIVVVMGIARNYLMVHYPSDVLGGMLSGTIGAIIAFYITKAIFNYAEQHPKQKLCKLVLQFDIGELLR